MPRKLSRITLEISDVRVQRLQDISEEDALAEGIGDWEMMGGVNAETPISAYRNLWESINGKKYPWASNPGVWTLTFKRIDGSTARG